MLDQSIKEIHIEPTSLCNAHCPQCARNIHGEGLNPNIKLQSLDLNWFKNNLTPDTIKGLNKIFFCGNVGDPAATPELLEIIAYLKKHNAELIIGLNTNGGLKTAEWWHTLGHLLNGKFDYCVFSIDGLEDTNHLYRVNVEWKKIMENVRAFISAGGSAHWDMLVFDHNKHQIDSASRLAKELGFTWFRTKETDRWDIYKTSKLLKPASLYEPVDYESATPHCEKDRDHSIFLDYTGKWWPCCHMAEAYFNIVGYEKHKDIRQYSNIELFDQYQQKLVSNPFYVCRRACGSVGKRSQWKKEIQLQ